MRRIITEFGFRSTAAEVIEGIDLSGKRVIVTGGASGIGIPTAKALAGAGAEVTLAVRNTEAAGPVAAAIAAADGPRVLVEQLDLADRASVAAFVARWRGPLHVLVNNAGVMALPEQHTPEGWEMQFATNHLGHFALANGLHRSLAAARGARIVSVSSSAHQLSPVVFDDIHFAFRPYEPILAYGQSKTANVLFAVEGRHAGPARGSRPTRSHRGRSSPTCNDIAAGCRPHPNSGRRSMRGRRLQFSSRRRRCSRESAGGTSSTATRPRWSQSAPETRAVSPPMRSIPRAPPGFGRPRRGTSGSLRHTTDVPPHELRVLSSPRSDDSSSHPP